MLLALLTRFVLPCACLIMRTTPAAPPPIVSEPWVRVVRREDVAVVETASRTYESCERRVELVGMVHCAEASYYEGLAGSEETTLYESILDPSYVEAGRLAVPLAATAEARRLARAGDLVAQQDALGRVAYERRWIIADLPRDDHVPSNSPVAEALSLLVWGTRAATRPVDAVGRTAARLACALAPCPELSLALVDWSWAPQASLFDDTLSLDAALAAVSDRDPAVLSRLVALRSLALPSETPRVVDRNEQVVRCLGATTGDARVLYGVSHMRDLDRRIRALGFLPGDARWRPAFSVPLRPSRRDAALVAAVALFGAFLLAVDAADYVYSFVHTLAADDPPLLDATLYFIRHAALYYALTKFVAPRPGL